MSRFFEALVLKRFRSTFTTLFYLVSRAPEVMNNKIAFATFRTQFPQE